MQSTISDKKSTVLQRLNLSPSSSWNGKRGEPSWWDHYKHFQSSDKGCCTHMPKTHGMRPATSQGFTYVGSCLFLTHLKIGTAPSSETLCGFQPETINNDQNFSHNYEHIAFSKSFKAENHSSSIHYRDVNRMNLPFAWVKIQLVQSGYSCLLPYDAFLALYEYSLRASIQDVSKQYLPQNNITSTFQHHHIHVLKKKMNWRFCAISLVHCTNCNLNKQ